jgi:hypothetical protein
VFRLAQWLPILGRGIKQGDSDARNDVGVDSARVRFCKTDGEEDIH